MTKIIGGYACFMIVLAVSQSTFTSGTNDKTEVQRLQDRIKQLEAAMPNIEVVENCQLEWDKARGVIYVHNKDTGATILRICGLKPQKKDKANGSNMLLHVGQIDITRPTHVLYPEDK